MQYHEMRTLLHRVFTGWLNKRREGIRATGRLRQDDITALTNTLDLAGLAVVEGEFPSPVLSEEQLSAFIKRNGLAVAPGTDAFHTLGIEYQRGLRDYAASVLEFDASLEKFNLLEEPPKAPTQAPASQLPLAELVGMYTLERSKADALAKRSSMEQDDHYELLFEILGTRDLPSSAFTAEHAQTVKATLLVYPKNRRKNRATRDLPTLQEVLAVAGTDKIAPATINKYLQTYISLFEWAKRNRYVSENFFAGMTINRKRGKARSTRQAFTPEQIDVIVDEAVNRSRGLVKFDWQKWGTLIAVYTGARLSEIAQLQLDDIRTVDSVLCFDLNDLGDEPDEIEGGKSIKTEAGKRLVPVHRRLLDEGLYGYVESLRNSGEKRLFPEFTYEPKDGWGRKLGRWSNNTFLVKLGYKSKDRVFHSYRHTVVTRLTHASVDQSIVKAIIGHAQEGVLQQHYFQAGYKITQLAHAISLL